MLRLRLPSGEELTFRSPEELTRAVRLGKVTDQATVFHTKTEQWLPVSSHPVFRRALESPAAIGPAPPSAGGVDSAPTALMAPSPLYAEPRRQPARGAEGLGRPDDARSDGLVLTLAAMLMAVVVALAARQPFGRPVAADSTAAAVDPLAWTGLGAPGSLALRHAAREERIVSQMQGRLRALSLGRPLLPDGVEAPALVDQALARLREARDTIAAYRRRAAVLDRAYSDSTGRVGQNDAAPSAPILDTQDSLYALAQSLTVLLIAERGRFRSTSDTISFDRAAPAAGYDRLRVALLSESAHLRTNPRTAPLVDPLPALPVAVSTH